MTTTSVPSASPTAAALLAPAGEPASTCTSLGTASSIGSTGDRGVRASEMTGRRQRGGLRAAVARLRTERERGSATAEYAVVILAAVAFAGVLVAVMRSGAVASILEGLVTGALTS